MTAPSNSVPDGRGGRGREGEGEWREGGGRGVYTISHLPGTSKKTVRSGTVVFAAPNDPAFIIRRVNISLSYLFIFLG